MIFQRIRNLWRLSGHDFSIFCPNNTDCKSCKRYNSDVKIFHAQSIFKNKQASIIDMEPKEDLFPNTDENGNPPE